MKQIKTIRLHIDSESFFKIVFETEFSKYT